MKMTYKFVEPWFYECAFPYFKDLKDEIKAIPGAEYQPETRTWFVPEEMFDLVLMMAKKHGFTVQHAA